jgi:hypothetical protein
MIKTLITQYVKLFLEETRLARVPQQLISPNKDNEETDEVEEAENVNEFSGVGAVAGYSAPLGMNPDKLGRKKNKTK